MPYFSGLDPLQNLLFRRRTPSVGAPVSPLSESPLFRALRTAAPPLNVFRPEVRPDFARLGQWIQGVTIPKPSEEVAERALGLGPSQLRAGAGLLESIIQSHGRAIERVSTPTGRGEIAGGLRELATTRPGLHTLANPAVATALDISDFMGIGFVSLGTRTAGKEALEKVGREAAEKGLAKKGIPKELELLAKEARRFKSAEEFIEKLPDTLAAEGKSFTKIVGPIGNLPGGGRTYREVLTDFYNQAVKGVEPAIEETKSMLDIIGEGGVTAREKARLAQKKTDEATEALKAKKSVSKPKELLRAKIRPEDLPDIDIKQKVNIFDYFRTPTNVLKKIGLGDIGEKLKVAEDNYITSRGTELERVVGWMKRVPDSGASQRIFRFLDGQPVDLVGEESKVAGEIKNYLADWADKLRLPEDKRIASYITHIFEKDFIKKEFDPALAKLIDLKVPGSVYNPFLEKRLGKLGFKEDVWEALDAYVKRATRKVNMDPVLAELKTSAKNLDLETYKYVQKYGARVNLRPTEIDNLIDNFIKQTPVGYKFGQRPTAELTGKFRRHIYRAALGLNVSSALRNLTQGINTYAKLGEKYTTIGYTELAKRIAVGNLDELAANNVLTARFIQDRDISVIKTYLQKMDIGLFAFFDTAEKINRGSAYFGAKKMALDKGLGEAEAVKFAKDLVAETQFRFGAVETPLALSSDIAKTILQFQSFGIKQLEFLGGMIKEKEFAGLLRFGAASAVMMGTIGKLFGWRPEDLIPSIGLGSPFSQFIGAGAKAVSPDERGRAEGTRELRGMSALIAPAGVQAKKTLSGLEFLDKGVSLTPTGRERFESEGGVGEALRALLFGPWKTKAGQEYLETNILRTKKKKPENVDWLKGFER